MTACWNSSWRLMEWTGKRWKRVSFPHKNVEKSEKIGILTLKKHVPPDAPHKNRWKTVAWNMWKTKNIQKTGGESRWISWFHYNTVWRFSQVFHMNLWGKKEGKSVGFSGGFHITAPIEEKESFFRKKQLTRCARIDYTITLRVFAFFRAPFCQRSPGRSKTGYFEHRKRRGNRWKEPISPKNCRERKFTASAKEWKPPTAGKFSREDATKAERDWPTNFRWKAEEAAWLLHMRRGLLGFLVFKGTAPEPPVNQ